MSESYAEFAEADGSVRMAGELLYPTATVGDVLTVQSDGSIAAAAGGGSSSVVVRGPFSFAFDTPGLASGVDFYTPTSGDWLLDVWVVVDTAWDGTTPLCDYGIFGLGNASGWLANMAFQTINLTTPSSTGSFGLRSCGGNVLSLAGMGVLDNAIYNLAYIANPGTDNFLSPNGNTAFSIPPPVINQGASNFPAEFVDTTPLQVVVSQDATKGGADPGSTQGAARIFVVTASPVAF